MARYDLDLVSDFHGITEFGIIKHSVIIEQIADCFLAFWELFESILFRKPKSERSFPLCFPLWDLNLILYAGVIEWISV